MRKLLQGEGVGGGGLLILFGDVTDNMGPSEPMPECQCPPGAGMRGTGVWAGRGQSAGGPTRVAVGGQRGGLGGTGGSAVFCVGDIQVSQIRKNSLAQVRAHDG